MRKYLKQIAYIFLTALFFGFFIAAALIPSIIGGGLWYVSLILVFGAAVDAGLFLIPFYKLIMEQSKIRKKLEVYAFTDRENELKQVCQHLKNWAVGEEEVKPICILCSTNAAGKTYFMMKIWHTVITRYDFYGVLGLRPFSLKNLASWFKINAIVYIDCLDDSETTRKLIDKINYKTQRKKTIFLFDNMTVSFYDCVVKKYNLIRYIYSYNSAMESVNNNFRQNKIELSRFERKDLIDYYNKLNDFDKRLKNDADKHCTEKLKPNDFDKILELTYGNIKQISKIFDPRQDINQVLNIDESNDEDSKILNEIELKLIIGDYDEALNALNENKDRFIDSFLKYQFRYRMLLAHCLHLLNKYSDAIIELSVLLIKTDPLTINEVYDAFNKDHIIELRLAHYKKHMGDFDDALSILGSINSTQAKLDKLGIYAAEHFLTGRKLNSFLADYEDLEQLHKDNKLTNEQQIKLFRYSPVYCFFKDGIVNGEKLQICIDEYERTKDHLIANAYFMKAELCRFNKSYNEAKKLYLQCLDYAYAFNDENLKLQVSMMLNYLTDSKKIKLTAKYRQNVLSYVQIKFSANKHEMHYNYSCANLFNSVGLNDPDSIEKRKKIDSHIFVIL